MIIPQDHLTAEDLLRQVEKAHEQVEVGAYYAHYRDLKSGYKVIGIATLEASQEAAIIYQKEGEDGISSMVWIRALSSWLEEVDVENAKVPRFQKMI